MGLTSRPPPTLDAGAAAVAGPPTWQEVSAALADAAQDADDAAAGFDAAAAEHADASRGLRERAARADVLVAATDADLAATAARRVALAAATPEALAALAFDGYRQAALAAGFTAKPVRAPALPIRGEAALSAVELAAWAAANRARPGIALSWEELAGLYLDEGAAAGVRGDVAFVQAALETGWFTNAGASYNNFAGIGHCDSCPRGFPYPDARTGVRAQVQLLRFYADPDVTTADLARPPAISWLDDAYAQGCCVSWFGLTGVWATALHYGATLLWMYESAESMALADRAARAAPPGDAVPAAG
jgi:hypothetical protein